MSNQFPAPDQQKLYNEFMKEAGIRLTPEHPASLPPDVVQLPNGVIISTAARQPKKNAWITFLLAFFTGPLGIHRFYLGHIGLGLLYLFTLGLLGVGALIDIFASWYITGKENERRGWGRVTE